MLVAVTGSSGKLGRKACAALEREGHRVVRLDRAPDPSGARGAIVEFTDFGQVMGALSGMDLHGGTPDAVVHLAALAAPGAAPDHVVFQTNTMSTYNVLSAASRLGVRRIVLASSETLYGLFGSPPAYLPIDEAHPIQPEWSYAVSKQVGELLADTHVRWDDRLSIASLRIANVYDGADYDRVRHIHADRERKSGNLWTYVDCEDAAEACRLAVEADFSGHERMIIAAADTLSDRPTQELVEQFLGDVPGTLAGNDAFLSSGYAAKMIGYRPRFSWRDRTGGASA